MADSSLRLALLTRDDLHFKVVACIEAPKVTPPLPTRTPALETVASADVPLVPRLDSRNGKNHTTTLSSAVKRWRTSAATV